MMATKFFMFHGLLGLGGKNLHGVWAPPFQAMMHMFLKCECFHLKTRAWRIKMQVKPKGDFENAQMTTPGNILTAATANFVLSLKCSCSFPLVPEIQKSFWQAYFLLRFFWAIPPLFLLFLSPLSTPCPPQTVRHFRSHWHLQGAGNRSLIYRYLSKYVWVQNVRYGDHFGHRHHPV